MKLVVYTVGYIILIMFHTGCVAYPGTQRCEAGTKEVIKAYTVKVLTPKVKEADYIIQVRYDTRGIGYYHDDKLTSQDSPRYQYYNTPDNPVNIYLYQDDYCNPSAWISPSSEFFE